MKISRARLGRCAKAFVLLTGMLVAGAAVAQEEGSVAVAIDGTTVKLSTVTYKPTGNGPFPTLIYHHGTDGFEPPYGYKAVANWFVARGWAVIAVFRRGRGSSEGHNQEVSFCAVDLAAKSAERALDDIEAAATALIAEPFVDRTRIAVSGHGRGGALSVAWSGKHPEVRAVINFAGAWVNSKACRYGAEINRNLLNRGITGGQTSLWIYGDKDLYTLLEVAKGNFDAFVAAGGKAIWHDYKPPGEEQNGHEIGQMPLLWTADVEAYLAGRGLPFKRAN